MAAIQGVIMEAVLLQVNRQLVWCIKENDLFYPFGDLTQAEVKATIARWPEGMRASGFTPLTAAILNG